MMTAESRVKAHQKPPGHTLVSTMQTQTHAQLSSRTPSPSTSPWLVTNHSGFNTNWIGNFQPKSRLRDTIIRKHTRGSTPCKQKSLHTDKKNQASNPHTWRPWPYPPSSTGVQRKTHRRRATSINIWDRSLTKLKSLLTNWEMFARQTSYLFEASVLDVELLGVDEVEQFAVLLSKEKETDR